jgi:hypothetical protein
MFELIVYLVMLSETLISDGWVTVHNEFARMWRDMVVA